MPPGKARLRVRMPDKFALRLCAILAAHWCVLFPASVSWSAHGQIPEANSANGQITGRITDQWGDGIAGAAIRELKFNKLIGHTDNDGRATLWCINPCRVRVSAQGFVEIVTNWQSVAPIQLRAIGIVDPVVVSTDPPAEPDRTSLTAQIEPVQMTSQKPSVTPKHDKIADIPVVDLSDHQTVTVTAYRTPLGDLENPSSTRVLTPTDLQESAPITLDGQLRLIPGAETFRRSSSLVANPSSQGISLRGLGSTSASRTLVTEDDIPLNDAFAGWIHWEELPELSIHSVEVVRGGASDLYGSSAIGGVINVLPVQPTANSAELTSSYGSLNTYQDNLLLQGKRGAWGALATGGVLGTDGFIQTAPDQRGAVDVPSNVHAQNGLLFLDHQHGALRVFIKGSAMNEARGNGTPVQQNGTRIWRFAGGSDWTPAGDGFFGGSSLVFRAYGSTEHYRQTFSTIATNRNSEVLNRFAKTPDDEMGLVLHWSKPLRPDLVFLAGSDTHDVRAGDFETVIKSGVQSYVNLHDRQRQTGAYAELLWTPGEWTISASGRIDWFNNFDGQQFQPTVTALPEISQHVFDPRLGIDRKLNEHFALTAMGFRAYRAPTANELYRSTQVGSLLTLPNNDLLSERATGWETGIAMQQRWGSARASYFWTQVNRPVTALTICATCNPIQLKRENLGQIESRGVSLDLELHPYSWMAVQGGYQYTNADVTKGTGDAPAGNWIPQVPHQMASAQLRAYKPVIGTLSLQARMSGHQFDDDANTYLLHSYFKLDAYASHDFGQRIELFTSGENLFDRSIEVGRTPTLTLGNPRTIRGGFNLKLGPSPR